MIIGLGCDEGFHRGCDRIIAPHARQGVDEDAFAVGTGAVAEKQRMLGCKACHAVAGHALQVGLQFGIVPGDLGEELEPTGTIAPWLHGWSLGDVILAPRWIDGADAKIDGHFKLLWSSSACSAEASAV